MARTIVDCLVNCKPIALFQGHPGFRTICEPSSRKEETAFENFARVLAEKELCPNLITQTGPTGGGDSKVDTETYPVASSIATLWFEGNPSSADERWGFAVSVKADWKPKIRSDVAKILTTGRPYTLIYFVPPCTVRDKLNKPCIMRTIA